MSQVISSLPINGVSPFSISEKSAVLTFFVSSGLNFGTSPIPSSIGAASLLRNGILCPPGNNQANGQRMAIRASGNFTAPATDPSTTVTLGLYPVSFNNPLQYLSTGTILTTPIFSAKNTSGSEIALSPYDWFLTAELGCTTGSGLVTLISGSAVIDGTSSSATSTPALVSGLSNIDMSQSIPFGLVIGISMVGVGGGSNANHLASMFQFDLSL